MVVVGTAAEQRLMERDCLTMRIPDDVFLELTVLLHRVKQHLPLLNGGIVGNSHQLGEGCLRIGLLALNRYVGP